MQHQQRQIRNREKKVEKLNVSKYKLFLLFTKIIFHTEAFIYMLYTLLTFMNIDAIWIGYIADVSLLTWLFMFTVSKIFQYCYVHRLPLYYILANEIFSVTDYTIGIPLADKPLMVFHLFLIGVFIFLYTYYYLNNGMHIKKICRTIIKHDK